MDIETPPPDAPEPTATSTRCSFPVRCRRVLRRLVVGVVIGLVVGNLGILGVSLAARAAAGSAGISLQGVDNLRVVDGRVLRGDAPSEVGYRNLAGHGVTTIVDLRAEEDLDVPDALLDELDLELVSLPIRDGQTPTPDQVRTFLDVVEGSEGLVYLHCGAGVGRTGAMSAAYVLATGQRSHVRAVANNLAVGPPSLEQIFYAVFLERGDYHQPPAVVSAVSRFFDAPRRLWSRYGF